MIDLKYYINKLQKKRYSIFLFHGVIEEPSAGIRNYTNKHILKEEFENLMVNLKKIGDPLSLDQVINYHKEKIPLPDFSFSITFDDGFENNYSIAKPILEKLSIPATFYISTNLVDKNLMTWTDQLEFCIDIVGAKKFDLPWSKHHLEISSKQTKIDFLNRIRKNIKKDPSKFNPKDFVRYAFNHSEMELISSNDGPLDKKMNWDQVISLHNHELFSIGGHSHNHVSLGLLKSREMKKEIKKSIKFLKDKANIETQHYSYPEGQEIDFNKSVAQFLKKNKIKCCPSAIYGQNNILLSSLFDLKRILVV
ncbi:MAG: polysaccharide deacetylase family protein [Candidatus Neomarinimicrobiota bacterium]